MHIFAHNIIDIMIISLALLLVRILDVNKVVSNILTVKLKK